MLKRRSAIALVSLLVIAGCAAERDRSNLPEDEGGSGDSAGSGPGAGGMSGSSSNDGEGGFFNPTTAGSGGGAQGCASGQSDDADMDGYTPEEGDCNDCDANVNPGAVEVLTPSGAGGANGGAPLGPSDEDCDGLTDEKDPDTQTCDTGLALESLDPLDGARAVDLCHIAKDPQDWGVLGAKYVLPDGASPPVGSVNYDKGHGILAAFGPNVKAQKGAMMLGVSSGAARQPGDPGYHDVAAFDKAYICNHPQGFPKESPSCGVAVTGVCHDGVGLEVALRAPSNAHGFSFNFNFYTYEWPGYVCSMYNDFFTALLIPTPPGQPDGNITFDNLGNPVSVNNAFMEVCGCVGGPPCQAGGKSFACGLGAGGLEGTGFGADKGFQDHGSTSWLRTQAPVDPGTSFTVRFTAYDSGDGVLDSTALVDNFQWIAEPGTTIATTPVPDPL